MAARRTTTKKPPGTAVGHRNDNVVSLEVVKADFEPPAPPRGLGRKAVAVWEDFWRSEPSKAVHLETDRLALERWITYVDEWQKLMAAFRRKRLVTGSMGQPVLSPLAAQIAQMEKGISDAEKRFGMTPLDRNKLGITMGENALTAAKLNEMVERDGPDGAQDTDVVDADAELLDEFEEA